MIKGWRLNPYWVHVKMMQEQAREMHRMYSRVNVETMPDGLSRIVPNPPDWVKDMK